LKKAIPINRVVSGAKVEEYNTTTPFLENIPIFIKSLFLFQDQSPPPPPPKHTHTTQTWKLEHELLKTYMFIDLVGIRNPMLHTHTINLKLETKLETST